MNKKIIIAILAFALLSVGGAVAQTTLPQVTTVNPTADRVQVIPSGQPSAKSYYGSPSQLATTSYAVVRTPTDTSSGDGYTSTFLNYQSELILLPALTMSYAYVTMAPNPSDGARECVFSKSAITALWVTENDATIDQSVSNQATSLSANSRTCMTFQKSNATWYRSE
jgi:hypothetical protein